MQPPYRDDDDRYDDSQHGGTRSRRGPYGREGNYGYEGKYGTGGTAQAGYGRFRDAPWFRPGPHVGRGPKGYQRAPKRIREDVCERLTWHGGVDATLIEVSVDDDEVTLRGKVGSRQAKRLAEDLAESVAGVHDVHNRLQIARDGGATEQAE